MSRTHSRAAASIAALALLIVPAGCGGGSSDSGSAKPLSRQQYDKRAGKVSQKFFTDVQRTQQKISAATDQKTRVSALDGFRKAFTDFANGIDKLSPPTKLKATQDRLVSKVRQSAGDIDKVKAAITAKSKAKVVAAQKALQEDVSAVRDSAQKLGAGG